MEQTALLIVDMLKDFFIPKKGLPPAQGIEHVLENCRKAVLAARKLKIPVIFVNDSFQKTEIPIDRHFKVSGSPHAIEGTEEAKIAAELEYDAEKDFIIRKKLYDGFYNTRLDSILREMEIKKCVVGGVYTHVCVQHTVMGAFCRGYDIILLSDGCASPEAISNQYHLDYMKEFYLAELLPTHDWLTRVNNSIR